MLAFDYSGLLHLKILKLTSFSQQMSNIYPEILIFYCFFQLHENMYSGKLNNHDQEKMLQMKILLHTTSFIPTTILFSGKADESTPHRNAVTSQFWQRK